MEGKAKGKRRKFFSFGMGLIDILYWGLSQWEFKCSMNYEKQKEKSWIWGKFMEEILILLKFFINLFTFFLSFLWWFTFSYGNCQKNFTIYFVGLLVERWQQMYFWRIIGLFDFSFKKQAKGALAYLLVCAEIIRRLGIVVAHCLLPWWQWCPLHIVVSSFQVRCSHWKGLPFFIETKAILLNASSLWKLLTSPSPLASNVQSFYDNKSSSIVRESVADIWRNVFES